MPLGFKIRYPFAVLLTAKDRYRLTAVTVSVGYPSSIVFRKHLTTVLAFAEGIDVELEYAVNYLRWIGNW